MQELLKEYGRKLKEYRLGRFLTQEDIATKLGLSIPVVSYFENGKHIGADSEFMLRKFVDTQVLLLETPKEEEQPEQEKIIVEHQYKEKQQDKLTEILEWLYVNNGGYPSVHDWRQGLVDKLKETL